jgi:hypothetical protein
MWLQSQRKMQFNGFLEFVAGYNQKPMGPHASNQSIVRLLRFAGSKDLTVCRVLPKRI